MNDLSLAPQTSSVQRTSDGCDAAISIVMINYQQFSQALQPLRTGSTADLKLQSLNADLRSAGARNKKNKLTQFDELATLYNRALLSKKVKPVVDKVGLQVLYHLMRMVLIYKQTMSDKESYTSVLALDTALNTAKAEFDRAATKPLAFPDSQDHVKVWRTSSAVHIHDDEDD